MRLLLMLSLFFIYLHADKTIKKDNEFIKCKIKVKNGIVKSGIRIDTRKAGFRNYMKRDKLKSKYRWLSREYSKDYIKHMTAIIGKETVLNLYLSPHTYYDPYIKYELENQINDDNITYFITDSLNKTTKKSCQIKYRSPVKDNNKTYHSTKNKEIYINPKAWEATSIKQAIKVLFPNANETKQLLNADDKMRYIHTESTSSLCLHYMDEYYKCFHDYSYPLYLNIQPNKELEFIAVLSSATPKSLLAVVVMTKFQMKEIRIPFQLEQDGEIFLIAKGKNGKLYRSGSFNMDRRGRIEGDRDDTYTKIGFDFRRDSTVSHKLMKDIDD